MDVAGLYLILISLAIHPEFYISIGGETSFSPGSISLKNEECKTRKTLVPVGGESFGYYPIMISLHRCGGVCGKHEPSFKKCEKEKFDIVNVNVFNKLTVENESLSFENHTSCSCDCVYDKSVCTDTQVWDPEKCECVCNRFAPGRDSCPKNMIWDPSLCKCICQNNCNSRQTFNSSDCSCTCHRRYYKRCNRKNKMIRETDCRCYLPSMTLLGLEDCTVLPAKWVAVIITLSVFAFFVLVFDCILYSRKTGCLFNSVHLCDKVQKGENEPLRTSDRTTKV